MGHSGPSGGSLNNSSSNNSAARFLQAFLCFGRWATWQSRLQYFTILQAVHLLRLISSDSAFPQLAQLVVVAVSVLQGDMVHGRRFSLGTMVATRHKKCYYLCVIKVKTIFSVCF